MKILLTNNNIAECYDEILEHRYIGFDTETFGLDYLDRCFSAQFATSKATYYANFLEYGDGTPCFEPYEFYKIFGGIFSDPSKTWFIHNAKFDMHKIADYNTAISGTIHDTNVMERILYNQHMAYSLDACLKRRGRAKNDAVEKWIADNKAWEWRTIPGKKKRIKKKYYDKVPFDIMFEYGCDDAREVLVLGMEQKAQLETDYAEHIWKNECELTKACFNMERKGVKVDREYIAIGSKHEQTKLSEQQARASEMAGEKYRNGPKWLRAAFDKHGQEYQINQETGNPIFDKHALAKMQSPIANVVKDIRKHDKYLNTYYSGFEHFQVDNILHATIRMAGTDTGRFSYADPNLQNIPKEEDFGKGSVQVRKCFVPREDHCFVMIDFDQQEYRLMLDYAGETSLINRIMTEGLDIHEATAEMMGVKRKAAKTLNFGILYGMGDAALAEALKIPVAEAKTLKKLYFARLPKVQRLIENIKRTAQQRGFIRTWTGRKLYCPKRELAYKMPNHLIQGGCGDIARFAMPKLNDFLKYYDSDMLIQVHDEILFEIHKDELDIVENLKNIMEQTYSPYNGMKLTCGVEHSWVSWGKQDVEEGKPVPTTSKERTR